MTWVDGHTFVTVPVHERHLLASLGTVLAELDSALQDFEHPCMHRMSHWDLQHTDLALKHLHLLPGVRRRLVLGLSSSWREVCWTALRKSVIHGDPNDYNAIVRNGSVTGFLDFGDLVHSATVCDLAIAMAYAVLDQRDPVAAAATIASSYNRMLPLTAPEIDALYPLMIARLCISVCYAAHNAIVKSRDGYQFVSVAPAWRLLERVAEIRFESAIAVFQASCAAARPHLHPGDES
jgi:Ser/Thr protein kinase RdoA (MazF antagonist)